MEQEIIRLLDADLECTSCRWKKDRIVMEVRSITNQIRCPYCGSPSTKVHSAYQREILDIPLLDKQMILLLFTRKLDTHRIIDILDSRETKQVENWLMTYSNLEVISRDGAQAYASAASHSHPKALQVSDRFHLLKNLSDSIEKYLYRLFPSRLSIPAGSQSLEWQALYDTRNRGERIRFAQKKRSEGATVNDIALLLHSSTSTILNYLAIPKDQVKESRENPESDNIFEL